MPCPGSSQPTTCRPSGTDNFRSELCTSFVIHHDGIHETTLCVRIGFDRLRACNLIPECFEAAFVESCRDRQCMCAANTNRSGWPLGKAGVVAKKIELPLVAAVQAHVKSWLALMSRKKGTPGKGTEQRIDWFAALPLMRRMLCCEAVEIAQELCKAQHFRRSRVHSIPSGAHDARGHATEPSSSNSPASYPWLCDSTWGWLRKHTTSRSFCFVATRTPSRFVTVIYPVLVSMDPEDTEIRAYCSWLAGIPKAPRRHWELFDPFVPFTEGIHCTSGGFRESGAEACFKSETTLKPVACNTLPTLMRTRLMT